MIWLAGGSTGESGLMPCNTLVLAFRRSLGTLVLQSGQSTNDWLAHVQSNTKTIALKETNETITTVSSHNSIVKPGKHSRT